MHATTEQLLAIKDGEISNISQHVSSCELCDKRLQELKLTQQQLQQLETPLVPDVWQQIQGASKIRRNDHLSKAIYALAASILIGAGVIAAGLFHQINSQSIDTGGHYDQMFQLLAQSQALENVIEMRIQQVQQPLDQDKVFRMERLKWRLKLIDEKIQKTPVSEVEARLALWEDRIRALEAINNSFYAAPSEQQI